MFRQSQYCHPSIIAQQRSALVALADQFDHESGAAYRVILGSDITEGQSAIILEYCMAQLSTNGSILRSARYTDGQLAILLSPSIGLDQTQTRLWPDKIIVRIIDVDPLLTISAPHRRSCRIRIFLS